MKFFVTVLALVLTASVSFAGVTAPVKPVQAQSTSVKKVVKAKKAKKAKKVVKAKKVATKVVAPVVTPAVAK